MATIWLSRRCNDNVTCQPRHKGLYSLLELTKQSMPRQTIIIIEAKADI